MTEKEKMMSGEVYSAIDPVLLKELKDVKEILAKYNKLPPSDYDAQRAMLRNLLGSMGDDEAVIIQPFYCDYGRQISIGRQFFANFNLTILDEAPVSFGDNCFIGPNVSIYTACHSTDPIERNTKREWARPVTIGDNVWIGGSVTILPGVTIGSGTTIGAGSVVVKDIPDNCVAVGNPCRVVRWLTPHSSNE
ncbi:MAG: sugar O-acetyltransferase [Bacteroidaceae bacterium]|nr:sugar O-acetyltransferase [Bacteroidaceae bacterium]